MARKKSPQRKEEIRQAAIKVISEVGFHTCTTDKIAEEAGISVGTIYNYFDNKQDILSYIFKVEKEKLEVFFQKLNEKEITTDTKIKLFLEEYFNRIYKNQKKAKLLHDESNCPAQGVSKEIFNYIKVTRQYLKDLLESGIKEGTIRKDSDLDMMASMIIGSANSIALLGHLEEKDFEEICRRAPKKLCKMLSEGLVVCK